MNERAPWVFSLTPDELALRFTEAGYPAFRSRQLVRRIYERYELAPDEMTEFPIELRSTLESIVDCRLPLEVGRSTTTDGRTVKVGLRFRSDEPPVEAVFMHNQRRRPTICVSSQLGCSLSCAFCSTASMGFVRNLSAGEILCQVWYLRRLLPPPRSCNVVFMGMGEPLANRDAVGAALTALQDPARFGISWRHMTVSTAGVIAGIQWMADRFPQVNLALSLNASDDDIREQLMPSPKVTVRQLVDAMVTHGRTTGRKPTFEYVLIDGINASTDHARRLGRTLTGVHGLVNVIPYNPGTGSSFRPPALTTQRAFMDALHTAGLAATLRRSPGNAIRAGCGQLASRQPP